jgi:hypothetical protein
VQAGEGEDVGRLATLGAGQLGGGDPLAERQRPLALLREPVLVGVAVVGQHPEVRVELGERFLAVVGLLLGHLECLLGEELLLSHQLAGHIPVCGPVPSQ